MTTPRRPPRPARLLVATGLVAVLASAGGGPAPVGALEQEPGIRVEQDQEVEREFGPIPGQNPLPLDQFGTPDDCRTAPWCDVIPLEIVVPAGLSRADEFFVEVELSWETQDVPSTPLGGTQAVNDLDLYVWDDPAGDAEVTFSGRTTQPEHLVLRRPTKGRYQLVVFNYLGPNTGYRLRVAYRTEVIEPPFELLEPDFGVPVSPPESLPDGPPPVDLPAGPEPAPAGDPAADGPAAVVTGPLPAAAPSAPVPDPLDPVEVAPDADFAGFDEAAFDEAMAPPPESDVLRQRQARAVGPPPPADGRAVAFWLGAVPLLLVAGGGWWLVRRGSAVVRFR